MITISFWTAFAFMSISVFLGYVGAAVICAGKTDDLSRDNCFKDMQLNELKDKLKRLEEINADLVKAAMRPAEKSLSQALREEKDKQDILLGMRFEVDDIDDDDFPWGDGGVGYDC